MSLVATFSLLHDAKLAQALLESAGIPTLLGNEYTYAKAAGGPYLQLYVPAAAAEDARDLLSSRVAEG